MDTILTDIANLSVSPGSEISFCCVNSSDISGETDLTGCGFSLVTNIILASPLFITNPTGIPFPSSIGDNLTPNWNMPNFIPDAGSQCIGAGSIDSETGKNTTIGYFCPPKAELSASPQFSYNPGPVTISAADSYDADGSNTIVRYDWDTDNDGTIDISDGPSEVSINYITLGVFSVKVIVTDNEDLQDNETIQIGTNGDFVETDHEPPVIEVTAIDYDPVNGIYTGLSFQKNTKILTKNNSLQLSLSFKDATPIRIKTTSMGVLNPNDTLDLSLPAEGMHTVTVTAEDSNSNVSFLNILVCLDQTPPDTRIFYPLPEFVSNNSEPWVTEGYIDILGDAGANFIKLYTQNVDEYMKFEVAIKITNTQTGTISFFEKQLTLSEIDDNIFSIDISTEITGNVGDFVRYLIQPLANDPAGNGKEYSGNYLDSARGDGENVYLDLEFPTSNNTSDDLTGTYYVSNDVTSLESIPDVLWPEGPDGPTEVKVYFGTSEDTGMKQVIFNPPLDRETVNSSYSVYIGGVDSAGNYNPNLLEVPLFQCDSDSIDKQDPVDKWFIKYLLENHSDIYDLMFIISRVDINGEPYLVDVSGEAEIGYYFIDNGTIDGITNVNDIKEFLISQSCPNPAPIPDGSLLSFGVSNYNEIPDFGASPRPNYVGLSDLPNNFQIPVEEGNLINEQDSAFTGLPLARSIDFESGSYNDPSAIDPTVQFELQKAAQRIKLEMPDEYVPFCTVGGTHGTGGAPRAVAVPINVYNGTSKNVTFYLVNDDPVTYLSPPLVIIDKEAPIIGTPLTREQIGYLLIPNTTICENEIEYLDGSLESSQSIAGQFFITHGARYYNLHHSDTDQTYNSVNYIDFKNAVAETKVAISEAKKFTDGTGKEYVKIIIRVKNQEGNDVFLDETYLDPSKTSYKGKFERSRTLNNDGKREIQLPIIFYNRDIVEPSDAMNDNWPDEYKKAYTQMKFKGTLLVPVRSNEYVQFEKIKILKMNNGTELPGQTAGKPDVFARVALSVLAEGLAGTEDGEYRATQEIVVMLNDDNDNGTFTPNNKQTLDKDENPVNGENDLIPVRWSFQSTLLQPVLEKIKVEILNGQDCVSLWDDGIKSNLIASGTEFPINSQKTIYIEGKKRGVAQVQFSCILGGKSFKADLVVHVAKVNITRTNGRFFAFEPEVANQITDLIPIFIFPSQEPDEGEEEEAVVLRADAVALQPVPGTYSWNINGGNGIRIRNEAPTDPDNPPNQQIATLDHLQNHNDAGVPTYLTVEFLPRRMREHFSWDWRVIRENTPVNLGSAVQELYVFQEKRVSACAHPNITPYTVKLEDGSVETYNVDNNLFQHYINICRRFICIDNDGVNPANHTHSSGKGGDCDDVVAPVNFESNWQEGEDGVFTGDLAGNDFNIIQDVTILVDLITEHPEVRVKIVEMFSFEDAPVARAWRNRPSLVIPKSALHNYTAFLHEYGHNANLGHRPDSTDGLKISENIMNYVSEFNWGREFNREEGTLILQEESDL